MYSTCLFCHSGLGRNEVIEQFTIGRRLAFDPTRGRLWVICRQCTRWNLTPIEERWEAIEECERRFRGTYVRVSTEHVGLARLREGLELVRIGEPLRPEFAAWRYGEELRSRRRRITVAGSAAAVAPVAAAGAALAAGAMAAVGVVAFSAVVAGVPAVLASGFFAPPWRQMYGSVNDDLLGERVLTQIPTGRRHAITVRGKHLADAELESRGDGEVPALRVVHDYGDHCFEETGALRAAGLLLARANWRGATGPQVDAAVQRIGEAGDAAHLLSRVAARAQRFRHGRLMAGWRDLHTLNVPFVERLAIEMAVHEETERRALEGELQLLEAAWRDAEEIAEIADNLLPPTIEDVRRRFRARGEASGESDQ